MISTELVPWERLPRWIQSVPPLFIVASLIVLRQAFGVGIGALFPFTVLVVLWLAMHPSPVHIHHAARVLHAAAAVAHR